MSRGSLSCWDAYPVPMSPLLRGDLPNEEYLLDPSAGTVTRRGWTPNTLDLDVALLRPSELLVNQNFHTGWRSNVGQVRSHDGLLAVALPTGVRHVRLSFRPRSAVAGAVSSMVALALAFWILRRIRQGAGGPLRGESRWLAAAAVIPFGVFATVYGLIREPMAERPPLRAPSGEEVLASAPPAGSRSIDATFGGAIVLEAVKLPPGDQIIPGSPTSVELDWRVVGSPPSDVEIAFALAVRGAVIARADHELLSAALRLNDAPRGVTLRDVVPFVFPEGLGPNDLDVWVGMRNLESHRPLPVSAPHEPTSESLGVLVSSLRSP
jgi:hypothetical protein